jgi:hypothetical protein
VDEAALERALAPFRLTAPFIRHYPGAHALAEALRCGLVQLLADGPASHAALAATATLPPPGLALLLALLRGADVTQPDLAGEALTPGFRAALPHLALMQAKLEAAALALPDFHAHLGPLLRDRAGFMAQAQIFALYRYDLALREDAAALAATARWMALTTALTRHEAPVLLALHDFSGIRCLLEPGGNSGEMALHLTTAHPALAVTVLDLPAVCVLGRRHVGAAPRIAFNATDLRRQPLPQGHDAVLFKSMLHDWPDAEAQRFLALAHAALPPGGQVLIFERAPLPAEAPLGYAQMQDMLFHGFYRPPEHYAEWLAALGFAAVTLRPVALDVPFALVSARR